MDRLRRTDRWVGIAGPIGASAPARGRRAGSAPAACRRDHVPASDASYPCSPCDAACVASAPGACTGGANLTAQRPDAHRRSAGGQCLATSTGATPKGDPVGIFSSGDGRSRPDWHGKRRPAGNGSGGFVQRGQRLPHALR